LGGRARSRYLHPFIWPELDPEQFDLLKVLNFGLLPSIYSSLAPREDLGAYVTNYLQLEVAAEGLTRNLPAFSRFLEVAAICNTQLLSYANVSNDAQVPASTVTEYFSILKDTLIGTELPVWKGSVKRKPIATSKFYFFNTGVARYLQKRPRLNEQSPEFGDVFEAWIHHELKSFPDYHSEVSLHFWRNSSKLEVDFILNEEIGIEVKAKTNVSDKDLKGLKALREEGINKFYEVSMEAMPRRRDDIDILPWRMFLDRLWKQEL
jgi:predicted AAA+ superfamily ATPase